MRLIRLLGAVIIFYGVSYLRQGIVQLIALLHYGEALANPAYIIIIINLTIGVVTFVIGIGLLLAKEWARLAWLVTVGVLLVFHCLFLVVTYASGWNPTLQILNVILIILLALISWIYFTKRRLKILFR